MAHFRTSMLPECRQRLEGGRFRAPHVQYTFQPWRSFAGHFHSSLLSECCLLSHFHSTTISRSGVLRTPKYRSLLPRIESCQRLSLFKAWSRSKYRCACFDYCQKFCLSSLDLLISFNFTLFQLSATIKLPVS